MPDIKHFLRFGSHKETKILKHSFLKREKFGLALNANVVAHTPASIYKMIYINFPKRSYFIDPQTYILQLDPLKYYSSEKIKNGEKKTELKNSVQILLSQYGRPGSEILNKMHRLYPFDLEHGIGELTQNVIHFQKNFLFENYKSLKEDKGYDDYNEEKENDEENIKPKFLIPPYFYLSLDEWNWLKLNERAIKEALKLEKTGELAAEIVMEKQILLSKDHMDEIVGIYNGIKEIETLFIWIDDFNETAVSSGYLKELIDFLKKFKNKKIINLFGGYFSLLLCKQSIINGFCHGPGYGEHRGVKPVGGGIPKAKYYLPYICKRIDFELASSVLKKKGLFNEKYFSEICDCHICRKLLKPMPDETKFFSYGNYIESKSGKSQIPTEDTLSNNQLHYLLRRFIDIDHVNVPDEKKKFKEFIDWNNQHRIVSTQHLENWIEALNEKAES